MPRFRFRIQTLMIAIAVLAVSITLLMAWLRWIARTDSGTIFFVFFSATIIFVLPVLLFFMVLSSYFGLGKTRRREFSRRSSESEPGPDRRGEPARV
jgi:ABC-type maltose transport system permease subunit